jgi:hypothetical protein
METKDATEVLWMTPSSTSLPTVSPLKLPIHTLEFRENAKSMAVLSRSHHTLTFQLTTAMLYKRLLLNSQLQSPLTLSPGNSMLREFSLYVENN